MKLPQRTDSHNLEDLAVSAFIAKVPNDLFLPRFQTGRDYGRDKHLEVLIDGNPANINVSIQIKGKSTYQKSIVRSHSLKVVTVNYLLNGTAPQLIVYAKDEDQLYVSNVRDEVHRLNLENSGWEEKTNVTLRLKTLDLNEFIQIHTQAIDESRAAARVNDIFRNASYLDATLVLKSDGEIQFVSQDDAVTILTATGYSILGSGNFDYFDRLLTVISAPSRKNDKILLLQAYSCLLRNDCHNARVKLNSLSGTDDLKKADKQFAKYCEMWIRHRTGELSSEELLKQTVQDEGDLLSLILRKEALRSLLAQSASLGSFEALKPIEEMVERILTHPDATELTRMGAKSSLLLAAGMSFCQTLLLATRKHSALRLINRDSSIHGSLQLFIPNMNCILAELAEIAERARLVGNPLVLCETIRVILTLRHCVICLLNMLKDEHSIDIIEYAESSKNLISYVMEIVGTLDYQECEIQLRIMRIELDLMCGIESDQSELNSLLAQSKALSQSSHIHSIESIMDGTSIFFRDQPRPRPMSFYANSTDEQLVQSAKQQAEDADLLPFEFGYVLEDLESFRELAKHRVAHCKHLEVDQIPVQTFYGRSSLFQSYCLGGFGKSSIECRTLNDSIEGFKLSHCSTCPHRCPAE